MRTPISSVYSSKMKCCGCSACANVCPVHAITMEADSEGFLYPVIDQLVCIGCRKCQDVCVFRTGYETWKNAPKQNFVYAARLKDPEARLASQSGGAFTALAEVFLRQNGIVYGAAFDGFERVTHLRVNDSVGLAALKGSKYIQSELNDVFSKVKRDLQAGLSVLFSGTPCQVAGLRRFLEGVQTDNLVLCDLICHSVASPRVWAEYVDLMRKSQKEALVTCMFRDKAAKGWASHYESFLFATGNKVFSRFFARLFSTHVLFRPSCSICPFANTDRVSDITLGDFWRIEDIKKEWALDNSGTSVIMVHTEKGSRVFALASEGLDLIETVGDFHMQPQLQYPTPMPSRRWLFWQLYSIFGFSYVRLFDWWIRIKSKLHYHVKRMCKQILKKPQSLSK